MGLNTGSEVAPAQPVAAGVLHSEPGPLAASTLGAAASESNANRTALTATIFRAIYVSPSRDLATVRVVEAEITIGWISLSIGHLVEDAAKAHHGHGTRGSPYRWPALGAGFAEISLRLTRNSLRTSPSPTVTDIAFSFPPQTSDGATSVSAHASILHRRRASGR